MTQTEWERLLSGLVKAELKLRGLSYADLVEKLAAIGVDEKEANIANKLSRGRFTAVFFAQCLKAIGSQRLKLD
ncbi:hypothetical protein EN836_20640 [Mesorhizobium sp. M1C.F.Ca.ET.193.01.1.1]|uniref:DUF6471 domain-containing protein n=1 Tax=unclassified Mesorhizobium TaxID=325217 RepID=UPI000FD414FF|nr:MULTISPECIES: DUF6471 domain-containing protein [unclassified Mesorhizobium]TGS96529.1 hypothetical protein EN820_41360 [bacterium M00.F.Ca.ET.177.01.1.1]TGQ52259.1 hypothetical protein EN853_20630 [Mesorhizobium sp. M1C.F.Ca.ET.210.01.1.1]TGQ68897.1 hypothetical protein EN855_020640 [Mesorhizobium sp. M1C.F.Ca.ET.212.01.1.1]TGR04249.1 hypothetical protein EN847_20635 [Mesorhizobium sp. M1C.F.Ca.ET.204.01.1.1]TGR24914.1 hypothetical protein EN839_20635 [Mesorhizobium sp. M1C.F.Ca.ET.196.01.